MHFAKTSALHADNTVANNDTELKAIRSALHTISNDYDNINPPRVNNINIVIFTDSQSAIQAIAQMQQHKQPIVTDVLWTANKLYNRNDVETFQEMTEPTN